MKKLILIFLTLAIVLTGCSTEYSIIGDSSVATLDGRMLYLRNASASTQPVAVDSCEVIHGRFTFAGVIDSICMGELCMDNEGLMPVVIEGGQLSVSISTIGQTVRGGKLNERLYKFLQERDIIDSDIESLSHLEARRLLAGESPADVQESIQDKVDALYLKKEKLEARFITDNYDNILGPTYFMVICSQYPYPIYTSQIKSILRKATPKFKSHPYVSAYISAADANMKFIHRAAQ